MKTKSMPPKISTPRIDEAAARAEIGELSYGALWYLDRVHAEAVASGDETAWCRLLYPHAMKANGGKTHG